MSSVDVAAELKAIAQDFGLTIQVLRSARAEVTRFSIDLGDRDHSDRIYVHATPAKLGISHEEADATAPLTYEEALELMLNTIGA
jgi:hypothetical protein